MTKQEDGTIDTETVKSREQEKWAAENPDSFLRGVAGSKTSYSEGWRLLAAETLHLRRALTKAEQERDDAKAQAEMLRASEPLAHARLRDERDTLSQQLTTLREALKEMAANWHLKAVKSDEEHGEGYAEEFHECADELSALLSEGGQ
jgi:hypothetical protein